MGCFLTGRFSAFGGERSGCAGIVLAEDLGGGSSVTVLAEDLAGGCAGIVLAEDLAGGRGLS